MLKYRAEYGFEGRTVMGIINYDNLRSFAYSNDRICRKPIRGVVLAFFGLGRTLMFDEDTEDGRFYAANGIIYLEPYNNPWNWMNRQAIDLTDEVVGVIFRHYKLPAKTPVVASGGSMGGHGALVYTRYAKRTPAACVVDCPVCDLPLHYTERPDLPRSIFSAYSYLDGKMPGNLKVASPCHLAASMPKVPYVVFHCEKDKMVNIKAHSEKFVELMREAGADITFIRVPDRGHCSLTPEMKDLYRSKIVGFALK